MENILFDLKELKKENENDMMITMLMFATYQ